MTNRDPSNIGEPIPVIMEDEFAHLNTVAEKLDWAAERMMGMQADADETPEIIADFAWLRDDEIEVLTEKLFNSIKDDSDALAQVVERCSDERWPVRIMMCFTKALMEDADLYRDVQKVREWFDSFRDSDPDPTEP